MICPRDGRFSTPRTHYSILIWRKSLRRSTRRRWMWSGLAELAWTQCRNPTATIRPYFNWLAASPEVSYPYLGVWWLIPLFRPQFCEWEDCNIIEWVGTTKFFVQNGDLDFFKKSLTPCMLWLAKGYVLQLPIDALEFESLGGWTMMCNRLKERHWSLHQSEWPATSPSLWADPLSILVIHVIVNIATGPDSQNLPKPVRIFILLIPTRLLATTFRTSKVLSSL